MNEQSSQWSVPEFASYLRSHNEDAGEVDDAELVTRAAADYSDSISFDGQNVTVKHSNQVSVRDFVDGIRAANPDVAHLSRSELMKRAREDAPDAFTVSEGFITFAEPQPTWREFPAESGSLGIPRAAMPQIKSEHRGAMVQYLKGRGITHSQEEVLPATLKPSQAEFSPEKVDKARGFEGPQRPILISSDDHVADGHHQWLSSLDAPDKPIPAIRLSAPIGQLLLEATRFPSSGVDKASAQPDGELYFQQSIASGVEQGGEAQQEQRDPLLKRSTPMPKPQPTVDPAHVQPRSRRPGAARRAPLAAGAAAAVETVGVGSPSSSALPSNDELLEASDRNMTPQMRSVARGAASSVAGTAATAGNFLELPATVDRGWKWLMGKLGIESADGPFVQAQNAARSSSATIADTVAQDRENEVARYGEQPAINQAVEGGTEIAVDMMTKYKAVAKLIELAGGVATPDKVMAFVNGIDGSSKGVIHTARSMTEGYVRGKIAKATDAHGPVANFAVQGGVAGGEELIRTGDARLAAKEAVLQGGMAARSAKGGRGERETPARLHYEVDATGNYTLRTTRNGQPLGEVKNVKPEELGRHLDADVVEQVRAASRVPPAERVGDSSVTLPARRATAGEQVSGVVNLPRSVVTSFDVSAAGRQGIVLAVAHPVKAAKAFGAQLKAIVNPEYARSVQNEVTRGPGSQRALEAGLFLPDWEHTPGQKLTMREEAYMSQYAKKVPGVAESERAYNVFLNKLRFDTFSSIADAHPKATPADLKALANFVNVASGRGSLGKFENLAGPLAQTFFSPRFTISRLQVLAQPVTAETKMARTVAAKELSKFFLGGSALLLAAKAAGAEVEVDPRSTDFGKIKVGRTRIDVWGGFQQIARNLTQQITGTAKTEEGEIIDIDRGEYGKRFLRSKLSPQVGLAADVASVALGDGKHINGEPVTPGSVARNLTMPLGFRDIENAIREDLADGGNGVKGALLGLPALAGVGVQTYEKKDEQTPVAKELRRLKVWSVPKKKEDETEKDYLSRLPANGVHFQRAASSVIASPSYMKLPDDEARAGVLSHLKNSTPFMLRGGLSEQQIDHNALVLTEEGRLKVIVDRSALSPEAKAQLHGKIAARFKYASVFYGDRPDKRKLQSIRRVFDHKCENVDSWLAEQMGQR